MPFAAIQYLPNALPFYAIQKFNCQADFWKNLFSMELSLVFSRFLAYTLVFSLSIFL